MSTTTYADAVAAIAHRMREIEPDSEADALELAREALDDVIDTALTYYSDTLALWDGGTHDDVDMSSHDDIMSAITASTYLQLTEDWRDAVYDGIDAYIAERDYAEAQSDAWGRDAGLLARRATYSVTYAAAGCLPDDDGYPLFFDSAREAWDYVADEVELHDDDALSAQPWWLDAHTTLHNMGALRDVSGSLAGPGTYSWHVESLPA